MQTEGRGNIDDNCRLDEFSSDYRAGCSGRDRVSDKRSNGLSTCCARNDHRLQSAISSRLRDSKPTLSWCTRPQTRSTPDRLAQLLKTLTPVGVRVVLGRCLVCTSRAAAGDPTERVDPPAC